MQKQSWILLGAGWALMGLTVVLLAYYRAHQRLGTPGVRVAAQPVYNSAGALIGTNAVMLPERVLGFEGKTQPIAKVVSDWLPTDTVYGYRLYQATNGAEIAVTVVLMGADRTSIHKPQQCLPANGWSIDESKSELTTIPISRPRPYQLPVMKLTVSRATPLPSGGSVIRQGYFVYWYVADQQLTASHKDRLWWTMRDLARHGVLQRWAYVSCLMECPAGQEDATFDRLREFLDAAVPQFQVAQGAPTALALRAPDPKLP